MKNKLFIIVALLIATVFVISACDSSGEAARKAINVNINANECTADDSCEMENANIINSLNAYRIKVGEAEDYPSPAFFVNMISGAPIAGFNTKVNFTENTYFYGTLTSYNDVIVDASIGVENNAFFHDNAYFYNGLTSYNDVIVDASIGVENNAFFHDNAYFYNGLTSYNDVHVNASLGIKDELILLDLTGNGNAYACIDSDGVLYRSDTACN